jgi:hypothetical protein
MTDIETQIQNQIDLSEWINTHFSIKFEFASESAKLAFTCFDITVEHHTSIVTLCKLKLFGSAFALLRVQFEALVRGLWLLNVASEADVTKFRSDKGVPRFGQMIKSIENAREIDYGTLSYLKEQQWSIFNSFTHTGIEALSRRMGIETTGYDNYSTEDGIRALRYSGLITLMSTAELALLKNDEGLVQHTILTINKYRAT